MQRLNRESWIFATFAFVYCFMSLVSEVISETLKTVASYERGSNEFC